MYGRAALILLAGCGRVAFDPLVDTGDDPDARPEELLVSREALVRYFIDEAATGQAATQVTDSLPDAFDLPLRFDDVSSPVWTTTTGGRALAFDTIEENGGGCRPLEGKLLSLNGRPGATLEVRAEYRECSISGSRYIHIGENDGWGFSLGCIPGDLAAFAFNQSTNISTNWAVPTGRLVTLTLVYDSTKPSEADRTRLYIDGIRAVQVSSSQIPALDEPLAISTSQHLCVGNRFIGSRTPVGVVAYAAIYATTLTDAEIATNAARLARSHDR